MNIIPFSSMNDISDGQLKSMITLERDTWGRRNSVHEYAICSDDAQCGALLPIEEVHHPPDTYVPLSTLESGNDPLPPCPECHGPTELYLKPRLFAEYTRAFFESTDYDLFGALLMDEDGNINGMAYSAIATRQKILEAINYRNAYDLPAVQAEIARRCGGDPSTPAASLYKVIIHPALRGSGQFRPLAGAMMNLRAEALDELEMISDTSPHSDLYPFYQAIGMEDLAFDRHGWVMVIQQRSSTLRKALQMDSGAFQAQYGQALEEARTRQRQYVGEKNPAFMRRRYHGATMLR